MKRFSLFTLSLCCLLLTCCGGSSTTIPYGGQLNHLHDMIALNDVPHTVLLASHIGLYRSNDDGISWQEVAGGKGQAMEGLMLYKLTQSPVNPKLLYVLAVPRPDNQGAAKDNPGIYESDDAGLTWHQIALASAFPNTALLSVAAGSTMTTLYALIPALGMDGVWQSTDDGGHWQKLTVPDPSPRGIACDPASPAHLYLWSATSGLFLSTDAGKTWATVSPFRNGVYAIAFAGRMMYVSSQDGLFRSEDGGQTFSLVNGDVTYTGIATTSVAGAVLYGLSGTTVVASSDGGTTWATVQVANHSFTAVAVDPQIGSTVFAASSYPLGVERSSDGGRTWRTVLP